MYRSEFISCKFIKSNAELIFCSILARKQLTLVNYNAYSVLVCIFIELYQLFADKKAFSLSECSYFLTAYNKCYAIMTPFNTTFI